MTLILNKQIACTFLCFVFVTAQAFAQDQTEPAETTEESSQVAGATEQEGNSETDSTDSVEGTTEAEEETAETVSEAPEPVETTTPPISTATNEPSFLAETVIETAPEPVNPRRPINIAVEGETIIRGELQDREILQSPTSAAVETGEELERRSEFDLYDTFERTPNITNAGSNVGIAIRGIDQRGIGGGGSPVIQIQVDGINLPSTQSTFFGPYSTWDLEQVEVLRGPQSTQQGRNSLAGAVIIRSKDPTYEEEYKIRGEVASRDTRGGAFAFNAPIIDDKLAFRTSFEAFDTDGFLSNPTLGTNDFDSRNASTFRAKLRWDPVDTVSIVTSYTHAENFGTWAEADEAFYPQQRVNFSDTDFNHGSIFDIFGVRANWEVNDSWTFESESTWLKQDYLRNADNDFGPLPLGTFERRGGSEAFEQDLDLKFDAGGNVRGVIGMFYSDTEADNPTRALTDGSGFNSLLSAAGPVLPAFPFGADNRTIPPFEIGESALDQIRNFGNSSENIAFYTEWEFDIPKVDGLTLLFGARYDKDTIRLRRTEIYDLAGRDAYLSRIDGVLRQNIINNIETNGLPPGILGAGAVPPAAFGGDFNNLPGFAQALLLGAADQGVAGIDAALDSQIPANVPPTETVRESEAFLPKFSVIYDWNDDATSAFTVQRAYRAGGSGVNLFTGQQFDFDPEFTTNYEFAHRQRSLDGNVVATANIFYVSWTDQQVGVEGPSGNPLDFFTTNAGESRVWGFEFSVDAKASDNLDLFAGVGYANTEFTNFVTSTGNLAGNSFGEPEWTAAFGGTYYFNNGLSFRADASFTGESFGGDVQNRSEQLIGGRFLVNMELAYQTEAGPRIALFARNVFDEDYITNIRTLDDGRRFLQTGEPVTFGSYVQWNF
ncbi:MAG: TonB-dependent receptor [Verrucomicrobiota bacterium]